MDLDGYIYDYRLGYVRGTGNAGFDFFNAPDAPAGRIVALGGYTTPKSAKENSSWTDRLAEILPDYQIISGCTDGYTSAQMLTSLIRDGVLFSPEYIICLCGFNNFAYKLGFLCPDERQNAELFRTRPFTTPKQAAFLKTITSRFGLGKDEIYYGEENNAPAHEFLLMQLDMMQCLCEEFGIKFKAFLQPCIFSGAYAISERENESLCSSYSITPPELGRFADDFRDMYKKTSSEAAGLSYVRDLSGIYNGETDVYTDACHVKPEYLQKISSAIAEELRDDD